MSLYSGGGSGVHPVAFTIRTGDTAGTIYTSFVCRDCKIFYFWPSGNNFTLGQFWEECLEIDGVTYASGMCNQFAPLISGPHTDIGGIFASGLATGENYIYPLNFRVRVQNNITITGTGVINVSGYYLL